MRTAKRSVSTLLAGLILGAAAAAAPAFALRLNGLMPSEVEILLEVRRRLDPLIEERKFAGTAALLSWEELYKPLGEAERKFLDDFRALRGKDLKATTHYFGETSDKSEIVAVPAQFFRKDGKEVRIDTQYLPKNVLEAYTKMMDAMERDIHRRLLVESGYRSPAYQLYLFLFYLPKHGYSILESNRHIALPGHSEHGYPLRQAIDFINEDGINGEDKPEEFEALPEFGWLQIHAKEHGFVMSYPRGNRENTAYEPWHWRYEGP